MEYGTGIEDETGKEDKRGIEDESGIVDKTDIQTIGDESGTSESATLLPSTTKSRTQPTKPIC